MKFTEHLSAHITPEWRKQYIQYEVSERVSEWASSMLAAARLAAARLAVAGCCHFRPNKGRLNNVAGVDVWNVWNVFHEEYVSGSVCVYLWYCGFICVRCPFSRLYGILKIHFLKRTNKLIYPSFCPPLTHYTFWPLSFDVIQREDIFVLFYCILF